MEGVSGGGSGISGVSPFSQVIPVDLDTATTQEKKKRIARPTQRKEVNDLPPVPPPHSKDF